VSQDRQTSFNSFQTARSSPLFCIRPICVY
jgi:hypothetical protein